MTIDTSSHGLVLTEEEALTLLNLAMTSTQKFDAQSERAIQKLASYCSQAIIRSSKPESRELERAV